ncbi:MAG: hypothetical protein F6K47_34210 [Symploca sp. SIO2E6]|nr:hypothetical protein [Symploca sp. SIO2E6]
MLKPLQQRKLIRLFNIYDSYNSGEVNRLDFELLAYKLSQGKPWSVLRELKVKYSELWKEVKEMADKNEDDRVNLDEWLEAYDKLISSGKIEQIILDITEGFFQLFDADQNGYITVDEYFEFAIAYDLFGNPYQPGSFPDHKFEEAFTKLDVKQNGQIDLEQLRQLNRDFFYSEDPNSPGNWLFGWY